MTTNWKTTTIGIATAFFAFVLFSPELFQQWPVLIALAKFGTVGGFAGMGLAAKDFNVTGNSKDKGTTQE